ncbi:MAG: hypothetical protein JNL72_15515, partial [Flavipsychrobacter sp.]|nr:hypothetical protein [Flavipsychrobacter sp.]
MNKKTLLILNIAAICIISTLLFSFKSTTPTYQYMTIMALDNRMSQVYISVDDKEYIYVPGKKYSKTLKGDWDQTGLI